MPQEQQSQWTLPVIVSALSTAVAVIGLVFGLMANGKVDRYRELGPKRDVLMRVAGNVNLMMGEDPFHYDNRQPPYAALNEAMVVFSEDQVVIDALNEFKENTLPIKDEIIPVIRAMAKAAEVDIDQFDDLYLTRPFSPPTTFAQTQGRQSSVPPSTR